MNRRILVVEDQEDNRMILRDLLHHAGYEVLEAVDGTTFEIAVTDTGPGIPVDEQQKIFTEFHQVDSSSTRSKGGTGLGLAISKQIVEMHGGRIWVESERGCGSSFRFVIPIQIEERTAA